MGYRPAQISLAVQALRPGLLNNVDFELAVTEAAPFISVWNRTDVAKPTQAEIEAVDTDALLAPRAVLAQDLMAQFTADDATRFKPPFPAMCRSGCCGRRCRRKRTRW